MEVMALDEKDIMPVEAPVSEFKCLGCHLIGLVIDLDVKEEEISDGAIYLFCPRCQSENVKPFFNGKIYD